MDLVANAGAVERGVSRAGCICCAICYSCLSNPRPGAVIHLTCTGHRRAAQVQGSEVLEMAPGHHDAAHGSIAAVERSVMHETRCRMICRAQRVTYP